MHNHYHLLVSPVDDDLAKMSLFAQKLGMGYSKFFNEKYGRSGSLWQGKHRKIHIMRDAHLLYIPYYIHLNPLDFSMPEWREGKIRQADKALKKLSEYRWSSFLDYSSVKNFPSVIEMSLLKDVLGSRRAQEKMIAGIIGNSALAHPSATMEPLEM